jgi:hypothetical protein
MKGLTMDRAWGINHGRLVYAAGYVFEITRELSRHLEHYLVSTAYCPGLAHCLTIGTPIAVGGLHGCDHPAGDQNETAAFADSNA